MKLISMVNYCQEVSKEFMSPKKPFDKNEWFAKILNYSDFLSQKLSLEMFVPCKFVEGVWVVLEEPFNDGENDQYYSSAMQEFKEAKDRVLFEGFEVFRSVNALVSFSKVKNGLGRLDWNKEGNFMVGYTEESTIEDFYNSHYTDLELTPTAEKKIGINH